MRRNKAKGGYDNLEHYLDVQFRLLREDFLAPLRDGIKEYMETLHTEGKVKKLQELRIYSDVQIICPICTNKGLCYRIAFDAHKLKRVKWEASKRLIFGSLLCLSSDNFQTLLFATVVDREPKKLKEGILDVKFEHNMQQMSEISGDERFTMAETTAYFEAYRHVLSGLQVMQEGQLPFEKFIVNCETDVKAPVYIAQNPNAAVYDLRPLVDEEVVIRRQRRLGDLIDDDTDAPPMYKFSTKSVTATEVPIMELRVWPLPEQLHLDMSQYRAIQNALTKEFVIIQGPPGTGKTYIGLKIVKALLHNHRIWNRNLLTGNQDDRPMLIVCYTNHALDQFLEGIIKFYRGDVIRVGGRSSSEIMKKYNLSNFRQRIRIDRDVPGAIHRSRIQTKNEMKLLQDEINRYAVRIEQAERDILHEDVLEPFIGELHSDFMAGYESLMAAYDPFYGFQSHKRKNTSAIVEWLGYGDVLAHMGFETPGEEIRDQDPQDDVNPHIVDNENEELLEVEDEVNAIEARRQLEEDLDDLFDDFEIDTEKLERIMEKIKLNTNQVALNVSNLDRVDPNERNNEGWQMTKDQKKKMKRTIRKELKSTDRMTEDEALSVEDMWALSPRNKWRLYRYWVSLFIKGLKEKIIDKQLEFEDVVNRYQEVLMQEDKEVMRRATVIGMTTTGAARYQAILQEIGPRIIVVEEAAEVLEAHIVTTLSQSCEHLILIGDHKQLKPNPTVYKLAKEFNLDLSLFERMINNKMTYRCLELQHRMRPEISQIMKIIYPELKDHDVVKSYEDVRGVADNFCFVHHEHPETPDEDLRSHSNVHEAQYVAAFCKYLLLQGYEAEKISVLTLYSGQLFEIRKLMPKSVYNGVRITVVDNYQGEENDIVILSLVRSNEDGNIGFLKIDNRVCVALSRAKVGFYVIGNMELMAANSKLWNEIVVHAHKNKIFGTGIRLYCQNHPNDNGIYAVVPSDFKKAPEGGCMKPCDFRLNCGHTCSKVCHTNDRDHEEYECRKPCPKNICDNPEHSCTRMCYQECGDCMVKVNKRIPTCGHYQDMACYLKPENFKCLADCRRLLDCNHPCKNICGAECTERCTEKVQKSWTPCGHSGTVNCFEKDEATCRFKCSSILNCEHICMGTCGDCSGGRLHEACNARCGRTLICGHTCNDTCSNCPPCRNGCQNRCIHSRCQKICGDICIPCMEPCEWRCRHFKCSKRCHEPCDRPRCNEPCTKRLKCRHPCIGLCGEPCPDLCRICDRGQVTQIFFGHEDEPGARFVLLEDCNHVLEVSALDKWMDSPNTQKNDKSSVQLKVCPLCSTPIRRVLRYGNMVKQALTDIEKVKKTILGNDAKIKELEKSLPRKISRISVEEGLILKKRFANLKDEGMSERALVAMDNQIKFLESLQKLKNDWNETLDRSAFVNEHKAAMHEWENMRNWVLKDRRYFSEQEIEDIQNELKRLRFLLLFLLYKRRKEILNKSLENRFENDMRRCEGMLTDGRPFNVERKDFVKAVIDKLKELVPLSGLGITEEERLEILSAMQLQKGHWYKCPNGHVYAIGDCGGANQVSTCPECKATIGGRSHQLEQGNAVATEMDGARYAAWSEQANLEHYGFNIEFE
ncbi:hypothetical protein KUTeg_011358 [Tegillarca granosa]|uniref:RZ-type domain-containing protein n=1 Tax=Tegillarca granosa TaxID=220873 RepID=A0ABQ9F114_TEGGR|nr:hypothetical protein KUTeg_011358 [Tegillarca granosa]